METDSIQHIAKQIQNQSNYKTNLDEGNTNINKKIKEGDGKGELYKVNTQSPYDDAW